MMRRATIETMKSVPRLFPLRWWLMVGTLAAVVGGVFLWKPKACPLQTSTENLDRGVTLQKFALDTPAGATQIYVVRGERKAAGGWRFRVAAAKGDVFQRETVTQIAQREKAVVAVNGGFFAYEGAAIGAVLLNGEWIRLPWKNRTALCIGEWKTEIANVRGNAKLTLNGKTVAVANLNGNPSKNAISILTPRFGEVYKVKSHESALRVAGNIYRGKVAEVVTGGVVKLSERGFVAVANGAAQADFANVNIGRNAGWLVDVAPIAIGNNSYTILGAGPGLLRAGKAAEASREEEFRPDVLQRGPRTAIGLDGRGNPLIVVADGHTECSPGLTLPELATLMQSLGATQGLHMDCGPSSVLVINGKVANRPSTNQPSGLNEPTVPNAVLMTDSDAE